jgi:anti-anti-sigma regulatory factor
MDILILSVVPLVAHDAMLVRPRGALTCRNHQQLHGTVLNCLMDSPTAVIVDLSETDVVDPVAAEVIPTLRREAAAGPGVNLLVCGADPVLTERLHALDPDQPLYPTPAEAIDVIHDRVPATDWVHRRLPPEPASFSVAGCVVADTCSTWRLPHLIHPARAVVFDLLQCLDQCPAAAVHVIASRIPDQLRLSTYTELDNGHQPGCHPDRHANAQIVTVGAYTVIRHTMTTATRHLSWAALPTAPPPDAGCPP